MAKTESTLISSTTVSANESTMATLSSDSDVSLVRATQCIFKIAATFNASTDGGLAVYFYPSADDTTYDDKPWDTWTIPHAIQVGYDAGSVEFVMDETITAASGGTGTVIGWTVTSGAWSTSDAAGVLYLESPSGTFANNDSLTGSISGAGSTQDGAVANHTIQRHYYPTSPTPMNLKGVVANLGDQDATNVSLKATIWSL